MTIFWNNCTWRHDGWKNIIWLYSENIFVILIVFCQRGCHAQVAPSEIKAFDGDNDELHSQVPVCSHHALDLILIAYGANPAVNPFTITLDGETVADDMPKAGIMVDNVLPADITPSVNNPDLSDSTARVSFPQDCLTLDDNGEILEVCDPRSQVCSQFTFEVVDSPDAPLLLTVNDPFAP
ncbi:uncharacterized protein [Amphiura filiformis]|uniref:uncharacterized protein n=1 Tax=Amphiura filiformis TaxID=82378 RepID=UPI003B21253C